MTRPRRFPLWLLALCVLSALACRRSGDVVAKLLDRNGSVTRDHRDRVGAFEPAAPGAEFVIGDGVRTGKSSRASLAIGGGKLLLEPETLLRFLAHPRDAGAARLELEMGQAALEAGDAPVTVETELGSAVLEARSRIELSRTAHGVRVEVQIGSARLSSSGDRFELSVGDAAEISGGKVTLTPAAPDPGAAPSAEAPPVEAPPAADDGPGQTFVARARGPGGKARAPGEKEFAALPEGETRHEGGTTLRVPEGVSVEVQRGKDRAELRGGEFVVGAPGAPLVSTTSGKVAVDGATGSAAIAVPGGSIVPLASSAVEIEVSRKSARVSVKRGGATLQGKKETRKLEAGERGVLTPQGTVDSLVSRGPEVVDLVARVGDSFVIHDPRPPTAIAFSTLGKCLGEALLTLGARGTSSIGRERVSADLGPGAHRYSVACMDDAEPRVIGQGTISVLRDGGSRMLPRSAPSSSIDADGRRYTVLYQNLLPKIGVRWPRPTPGAATLLVSSGGGVRSYPAAAGGVVSFPSGALSEGAHELVFEAGGKRSRPTTLTIRFDNAAPTASISSPADGSFAPGASVVVEGVALPGWSVMVDGNTLPQDSQNRFSGRASAPSDVRALAIRFAQAKRGVHYYLRRSAR